MVIPFSGTADDDPATFGLKPLQPVGYSTFFAFEISSSTTVQLNFKLGSVQLTPPSAPNFALPYPVSGRTPTHVYVGLNPQVTRTLGPGNYGASLILTTVDQTPPSTTGLAIVLELSAPPPPVLESVLNTASYKPEVSPGEIVSVLGQHIGSQPVTGQYDSSGLYPTTLGGTTVTFGGVPAGLLYVSPGQVNAIVPYTIAGNKSTSVVVTHWGKQTTALSVPVAATTPGIYTSTQTGTGQAAVLQFNPGASYNSADNPASGGTIVELFATGAGAWTPAVLDATVNVAPTTFTTVPVSLTIGGQSAQILYAGSSPFQSWGLLQINAVVPQGLAAGQQPLMLKVGQGDNAQQQTTIAIK
jgi:uncharacterized protein (TIGR03437 family)